MEPVVFRVSISRWITDGWNVFLKELGTFALIGALSTVLLHIPFLWGPVWAAMLYAASRLVERGRATANDYFDGFKFFLPALLASLIAGILSLIGLILLILPGLIIITMYLFTPLFICEQKMDFLEAMAASRKMVSRDYLGYTLFMLTLLLLNLLGMAFFYVGLVFTLPVSACAMALAYREALGLPVFSPGSAPDTAGPIVVE